jgi:hypothetical protein
MRDRKPPGKQAAQEARDHRAAERAVRELLARLQRLIERGVRL